MPGVHWPAAIAGVLTAVLFALVAHALLPAPTALIASLFGIAAGGFVAGKWAVSGPAYHGAIVGAGYILGEALGVVPSASYTADPLGDTLAVIVLDLVALASATLGGWIAGRASSSGTGRAG